VTTAPGNPDVKKQRAISATGDLRFKAASSGRRKREAIFDARGRVRRRGTRRGPIWDSGPAARYLHDAGNPPAVLASV